MINTGLLSIDKSIGVKLYTPQTNKKIWKHFACGMKCTKSKIKEMILARKSAEGRPPLHQQMTPTRRSTNREQEEEEEEENLEEENVNDSQVMINVES